MALGEPPELPRLAALPARRLAGTVLHRIHRRDRHSPWWFSAIAARDDADASGGRFDLPYPDGACYLATSLTGALLEAFQDFGEGLLPDAELRCRANAVVRAPASAPRAAWLSADRARGVGVTAALWAGGDRALTQRWAATLRRAGWRAVYAGLQHDPSGRLRGVTLFDRAGEHAPYDAGDQWPSRDRGADR